jgi:SAM-dependent methyltransferase
LTETDLHWKRRAATVADDIDVNTQDVFQRDVEFHYIERYLTKEMRLLEVGCGNGFSTARLRDLVAYVDALDFAPDMVERARRTYGEENNRFFCDDIRDPKETRGPYEAILCVRVLINLASLEEQIGALRAMADLLIPGGLLILVEGFRDGFEGLNRVRAEVGLEPLVPAKINVYSSLDELLPEIERHFEVDEKFHLGSYDYLTRVVYPLMVKPDPPMHNTVFSERAALLAPAHNADCFEELSRVRGSVLRRRN